MKASKLVASFFVLGLPAALIAGGCSITANGGGGNGNCASVCSNYPSCGSENNSTCLANCNQLQSACSNAGKSGIFEDWAGCGPQFSCQGGQVQQTNCVQQGFELLQCPNGGSSSGSSSGKGGSSSGHSSSSSSSGGSNSSSGGSNSSSGGSNSSSGGSNSSSGGSNSSSGGSNSSSSSGGSSSGGPPPPCYANTSFSPLPWATPTNLHQNVCASADVTAFNNTLSGSGPYTSGNATCDACIMTDSQAAMLGPVLTMGGTPIAANWGGCIADFDNNKAGGSCGNTFNNYNDCFAAECATCSDWSNGGPVTQSCGQAAFGNGGPCAADSATQACIAEIQMNGIAASCGPMLTNLITVWCGP